MWQFSLPFGATAADSGIGNGQLRRVGGLNPADESSGALNLDLNLNFLAQVQALIESGVALPPDGMSLPQMAGRLNVDQVAATEFFDTDGPGGIRTLEQWLASSTGDTDLDLLSQGDERLGGLAKSLQGRLSLALHAGATQLTGAGSFGGVLSGQAGVGVTNPAAATGSLSDVGSAMLGLPQRVGDAGWGRSLADRVVWLAGREQQVAELKLNPPNLGPLEVRIVVQQDQASISFLSQHAVVREALEQAMPRLRDMLEQHDLRLVQADIGGQSDRGREAGGRGEGTAKGRAAGRDGAFSTQSRDDTVASPASGSGLVDLFA